MISVLAQHRAMPISNRALLVGNENRLFTAALAIFVVLVLALSPFALTALGFDYTETGGSVLTKFHPATFYVCGLATLVALASGDPFSATIRALREAPSVLLMWLAILLASLHALLVSKLPITPLIETLLPATMALLLLRHLPETRGRTLALLIHALMIANAGLAIFEFLSGWRLTPFVIKGADLVYEWRATALLGHPLANAVLTGCYIVVLALGGGRDLPQPLRVAAFFLSLAAMAAFGGRAAAVLVLLMLTLLALRKVLAVLNGAPINRLSVLAVLAGLPFIGAGLMALLSTNFLERFINRFADDSGSAQTRSDMFEIFAHIPLPDLLVGADMRQVTTWQGLLGMQHGVESFWLSFILFYGLLIALVLFAALLLFCREIVLRSRPGATWVLVYFIGVASLSLSLAGKSNLLTIVTLLLLVLMRRPAAVPQPIGGFTRQAPYRAPGMRRA